MLVNAEGRLTDVVHFSFGGFYLLHSSRQENGWQSEPMGEQGDGFLLDATTVGDTFEIVTDVNRFNADPVDGVFLRWKRGDTEALRERLPDAIGYAHQIARLPNGQPVVLQFRRDADGPAARLLTRTEKGWSQHQRLPAGWEIRGWGIRGGGIRGWELGPDGDTYIATWQAQQHRLVLWRGKGDNWSGQIVSTKLPADPTWIVMLFDPQGRPVVAAGRLGEPFGWVKAFRTKGDGEGH